MSLLLALPLALLPARGSLPVRFLLPARGCLFEVVPKPKLEGSFSKLEESFSGLFLVSAVRVSRIFLSV